MPTRTDIREALKGIYEGVADFEKVYLGRRRSIDPRDMPAICIYFEEEEKELAHIGTPRVFDREAKISSEIHVQGADAEVVEALLDDLCEKREAAVLADETLSGLVEFIQPTGDDYDIEHDGKDVAAVAKCADAVRYR